ncbi:MAG TPA: helix-turn-helix domain-containing protein [Chthoniobacterales bacterium]|nr:helix-turn-helix domain-containing protein [Chthoniobacterales bacterium]
MSIRLMSQVWEDTRIGSQAELLVLLALADHARDDGLCWPSMRSIAGKARIEERSAQRIIRRLIEKRFVELVSKGGCIDGQNTPNRYRVIGGDRLSSRGPTESHSGVTVGQGVRGDRESPRGDSDDTDGVTQGRTNHHIEPSRERITTTTYPDVDKEVNRADEPTESSSSRRDFRAVCGAKESGSLRGCRIGPSSANASALANQLATEFGLSKKQRQTVSEYCESRGQEYVWAKTEIVRSQPRRNAAGALLAALRDDWQLPVLAGKPVADSDDLARRMGWQW